VNTTSKCLGIVDFSGKVVISDPCYPRGTWCMKTDFSVKPGRYQVFAAFSDEGEFGLRVAALTFCHEDFLPQALAQEWEIADTSIGVDSGQCGIFDDAIYPQSKDHPDFRPFYDECCELTLSDEQAGILQSGMGALSSSGYGDGGYSLSVVACDGENVALLLDYALVKMRPLMLSLLQQLPREDEDEQDAAIIEIIKRITAEINTYRKATQELPGEEIYDKAFEIHLWEEMAYFLCECSEDYEENDDVLTVLDQLTAGSCFISAFVNWAMSSESVDVTNTERTFYTLERFCEDWLREHKGGY